MNTARKRGRRPLPPYADTLPDGDVVCAMGWKLGAAWPRFVLPPGASPEDYDLRFVAGRSVTVLHSREHSRAVVDATLGALLRAGAESAAPMSPVRPVDLRAGVWTCPFMRPVA